MNQIDRKRKMSELKNENVDCKIQCEVQIATTTLYFLQVCAVMLHWTLSRKKKTNGVVFEINV